MPESNAALEERVLLVAPTRRDCDVTCALLGRADVQCTPCADVAQLVAQAAAGVGAVMLTDHALHDRALPALLELLQRQPPWSDVPVVLLSRDRQRTPAAAALVEGLTNVTQLDRPLSTRSMVSAVRTALLARRRQYELRDRFAAQAAAEQALRDADRRKDEFLATLAHELRNPLAPLRNGLELLGTTRVGAEQAERLRTMMQRQLGLLIKLIDDLLDVSRIATGKVGLQVARVDMRQVVHGALEGSQHWMTAAGHRLQLDLPGAPVWVDGDLQRLEQVIANLLNNASKYTPDGGDITLALRSEGGDAVVRVTDNGVGIPAEMLPEVFEMFTQVNRSLDRAQGGLGIGLSLVRRLVQLHGGSASAASAGPDTGSTFTVRLPLAAPAAPRPEPVAAAAQALAHRVRVLVVDDNVDAADALTLLLRVKGHDARTAYDGAGALREAETFAPQAIFCDIGMPGMDGHAVGAALRAQRQAAVLVALTGWGGDEDRRRTRAAGFDRHVTKPISEAEIDAILAPL